MEERKTTIAQEIRGGLATFLTMSYILLVNPQVISKIGIPAEQVVIATALSGAVGCLVVGLFGNLPFGLSPGIGLSAYLVYGIVLSDSLSIPEAFTACFISGIVLSILSLSGLSSVIMRIIPRAVKLSIIAGMGLQIALVGMTSIDMVVANPRTIVGLGPINNYRLWFGVTGLLLIGSLMFHQIEGALVLGIVLMSFLTWTVEDSFPTQYFKYPQFESNVSDFLRYDCIDLTKMAPAVAAFLFIGIVDVGAVCFGMASLANITDKAGTVPGSLFAFLGCAAGTLVGSATGSTPVIVYCETAAGIKEGGRTGVTAVVIGFFFLLSLFFAPVFSCVPATATAPVSILVGAMMMSQAAEIDWSDMTEAIPAFLTMVIIPFTFSITNGIMFGLLASVVLSFTTGRVVNDVKYFLGYDNEEGLKEEEFNSPSNSGRSTPAHLLSPHQTLSVVHDDVVRTPSLILSKSDATAVRNAHGHSLNEARARSLSAEGLDLKWNERTRAGMYSSLDIEQ